MTLSYSLVEHFDDHDTETTQVDSTDQVESTTTESQEDCMVKCEATCRNTPTTSVMEDDGDDTSLDIEDGSDETTTSTSTTTEGFSNMNNSNSNSNSSRSLWSLDLLLKAVLFSCLFYVLAHNKTRAAVTKYLVRGKENVSYVLMLVFALVYYLLHLVV